MRAAPVAADSLPDRIQSLAACRPYGKFQDKPLCVWTTGDLKPDRSEQRTALAEWQLPVSGQFMNVEPRTLHVSELSLRKSAVVRVSDVTHVADFAGKEGR